MKKKKKQRRVTLIEIMIVIMLISLIGGALAFNMRGSMDKGRAFKTEQNIGRIHDILLLAMAENGKSAGEIVTNWSDVVKNSPIVRDESVLNDGWGKSIAVSANGDDDFTITSDKLNAYYKNHKVEIH